MHASSSGTNRTGDRSDWMKHEKIQKNDALTVMDDQVGRDMAAGVAVTQKSTNRKTQIVVVGGGAGGLELVRRLGAKFGRKKHDIILVDRNLSHIWKPLLHEVASRRVGLPYLRRY